eukprot:12508888-Alexandrium_andersonii.AAC.1
MIGGTVVGHNMEPGYVIGCVASVCTICFEVVKAIDGEWGAGARAGRLGGQRMGCLRGVSSL